MNDNKTKAREFCSEVKKLSEKYNLPVFMVTEGASVTNNDRCEAVKNARDNHIKWEEKMVLILPRIGVIINQILLSA